MTIKKLAKLLGAAAVVLMLGACVTVPESGIITPGFPTTVPIESAALSQEQDSAPTAAPEPTPETESTENLSIGTTMAMEEILAIELGFNTIDLAVEITNELETVVPGQQVIYKITVTNNNWNAAYGVRVTVELPSGISHDSDTAVCDQQVDGRLFCNPGYLEAYKSRELLVAAVVDSGLQADVDLTTNVSVEKINVHSREYFPDLQVWPDPVPENNSAANTMRLTLLEGGQENIPQLWTVPIHLQEQNNITDLRLYFGDSVRDGTLTSGLDFYYQITIVSGSSPARDVRLSIDLPEKATYQPNGEACIQDVPHHLDCVIGEMKINTIVKLSIHMLSDNDLGQDIDGFVTITSRATVENLAGPDPDPSNNTVNLVTRVKYNVSLRDHILDRRARGFD